eukprot:842635-Karenia_brevis.AAC.1
MCCDAFCQHAHRQHEKFLEDFCASTGGFDPDGLDLIPGAVTKVLTKPEIMADPKNIQAIKAEGDALRSVGTWDEST